MMQADIDALFRMVYNTSESDWDKILAIFGKVGKDDRLDLPLGTMRRSNPRPETCSNRYMPEELISPGREA